MTDSLNNNIKQLVAEIVDAGPVGLESPPDQTATADRGSRTRFVIAAAVLAALLVTAVLAVENRDQRVDTGPAVEQSSSSGNRYRYTVTDFRGLVASGEVDLVNDLATYRLNLGSAPGEGPDIEMVTRGDEFATRFSQLFAGGEIGRMPEFDSAAFYDVDPFGSDLDPATDRFNANFAEATKTREALSDELENPQWVEVGRESVNGMDTLHVTAEVEGSNGEEIFITNSLLGFVEVFDDWTGTADAWIRDDGLVSRVVLVVVDSGQTDTVQLDYLDYGAEIEIEWPDVLPAPPELAESMGG